MPKRLVIGTTEPSKFIDDVIKCIEQHFDANPVKLSQNRTEDLNHWVDQCNGVILAGGVDIHPRTYGHSLMNNCNLSSFDVDRDRRELAIIHRCIERNIPLLGICRGHQMLGVFNGMRLIMDLSGSAVCHSPQAQRISHQPKEFAHWVRLTPEGKNIFKLKSEECLDIAMPNHNPASAVEVFWVNSFHHQGIKYEFEEINDAKKENRKQNEQPPKKAKRFEDVQILGYAADTGTAKIVELMRGRTKNWISCQWHPEYDYEYSGASRMVLAKFKEMMLEGR